MRSWFRFLVAGTLLGAILSLGVAILSPASYASRVTVLVAPQPTAAAFSLGDVEVARALAPTFAELATTSPVLERVVAASGVSITPDRLAAAVETRVPAGTSLIEITVSHASPAAAATLANAIATELEQYPSKGFGSRPNALKVALFVVDPGAIPTSPKGPGVAVQVGLGTAIALFLSTGFAFFVENLRAGTGLGDSTRPTGPLPPAFTARPPEAAGRHNQTENDRHPQPQG